MTFTERQPAGGYQPKPNVNERCAVAPVDPSGVPFVPKVGDACLYKERGGVNWCACQVIAEYDGLLWIHNFYTGAHPVKRIAAVEFKPMPRGLLGVSL